MNKTDHNKNLPRALADALSLGTSVAAAIAIGLLGGRWLDDKFDKTPLFTILGLLLAALTCGKMMWERLMADNQSSSYSRSGDKDKK